MKRPLITDSRIDLCSKVCLAAFGLVMLLLATLTQTYPVGESANYMLATISLENRLSLDFTAADVAQAQVDFPEHYDYIKACYDSTDTGFWTSPTGHKRCYYYSVYSLLCIPMKKLLAHLELDQSYTFAVTNALLYMGALVFVYCRLKADRLIVLLTILLLACSPTVLYYYWPGAEICMFALLIISLVYFANHNHKMAALFVSIAGMMNPTVMAYGAMIIVDYFLRLMAEAPRGDKGGRFSALWRQWKEILLLALCFVPCLIPFANNYAKFGVFVIAAPGVLTGDGYGGRFLAYLTDLNFGILPYFPLAVVLTVVGVLMAAWRREFRMLMLPLALLLTIAAYCINRHINCGMAGIHRYNAWAVAIMIFFLTSALPELVSGATTRGVAYGLLALSALLTGGIVWVVMRSPTGMEYTSMGPIAERVLDRAPQWYSPSPSTFISRVNHVDGGYVYNGPVIYFNELGYARKILVTPETALAVLDQVTCSAADYEILKHELERARSGSGFRYIDLNRETRIVAREGYYEADVFSAPWPKAGDSDQTVSWPH